MEEWGLRGGGRVARFRKSRGVGKEAGASSCTGRLAPPSSWTRAPGLGLYERGQPRERRAPTFNSG